MNELRQLTDEQRMIVDTVDAITDDYGHDYWYRCIESDAFVTELWEELADLEFLGIIIPEQYGGAGLGMAELAILLERFGAHGVPLLSFLNTVTMAPIPMMHHGSDELKQRFLPGIASGDLYFAFAITEPDAGTNSFRIKTRASREGDEYIVNGQKTFITGADRADYVQLVTRTTPYEDVADGDKRKGGTLLTVDMESDGIELQPLDLDLPEPANQYTVHFDDVRVPVENRIGTEGEGFLHVFDALNPERIGTAALSTGMGEFVLERAVEYAKDRSVFDAPIGSHQGVQHPLSRAKVDLELAKLATGEAARAFEASDSAAGAYANMAKFAASEAGDRAMDAAMQTFGGNAFSTEYDIITLHNWTRFTRIAPVNNEMVLNHIGESLLGLPRSY